MTTTISNEAKDQRNQYQREWRRKNGDKQKQYMIDYWERKAAAYTPEMKARELHAQCYTQREIAEELGVSLGTVNKYLNEK